MCQLTKDNCIDYQNVQDAMTTALPIKLTTTDYPKGFPRTLTYVQDTPNNSNSFRLLYRLVEIIHPHDIIYKNYLLYELLSPEKQPSMEGVQNIK